MSTAIPRLLFFVIALLPPFCVSFPQFFLNLFFLFPKKNYYKRDKNLLKNTSKEQDDTINSGNRG